MASVSELTDGKYTELTYNAAGERIKGEFVQTIRELIRHCGLSAPGDNVYDMALANTVAEFQRKVGIPATGTFNDDTYNAMISYSSATDIVGWDGSDDYKVNYGLDNPDPHYDSFFDVDNAKEYRKNHMDIKIVFGNNSISKTIKNVFMRSSSVEVDTSGNPIYEVYEFIARDIVESDEPRDKFRYNDLNKEGTASSDVKYLYDNLYKK